jgi:broad specificity phosphatase PhoE
MIYLYLIRHCQVSLVPEATHPRHDVSLSRRGTEQAEALAKFLSGKPIDLILTSLFKRAQETADAIRADRVVPVFSSIALNEYQLRDDHSGVETTDQAMVRSLGYLYQFAPYYDSIAVVAHNAILSTIRMRLMNLPFESAADAFAADGACRILRYDWQRGDQNWGEEEFFAPENAEHDG